MLSTMTDMKWTVHVHKWTWIYTFTGRGSVSWKDPFNGMTGQGTWRIEGGKVVTRWLHSKTWEAWDTPIDPLAARGKCHMQEGTYDLRAEALNFVEIDTPTCFTRSPEGKARFLESCNSANRNVQISQVHFGGWLSSISIAYGEAFEAHSKILNEISAKVKLANELLLGFALAFLGGGVGGLVGKAMKDAGSSDFMIDGVKDLAKFAVRGPGGAALRSTGISGMPTSPFLWQNRINERVLKEMSLVLKLIESWRTAVQSDDDGFDAGFDPAQVVDRALVIKGPSGGVRLASLPEVNKITLQQDFEKGWLVAWIKTESVSNIPMVRDSTRDTLRAYGLRLGLQSVGDLLDKYCPQSGQGFIAPTFN